MKKVDPFTRTPGVAGAAFIDMHYADEIIGHFDSDESSKYVYKIVGLRGSGKSVAYGKIINTFSKKKKWKVYTLSAAGDPVSTLIAKLSKEPFIHAQKKTTTVSAGGNAEADVLFVKGGTNFSISKTSEENDRYYSAEAVLSEMVEQANRAGYKILAGVDDIARTQNMVEFLSILGTMFLDESKKIYFICTGLAKNIEDFADEPSLTFFKRSDPVEIKGLNQFEISAMYQKLLGIGEAESVKLAKFTGGYAYAYQVLGSLYFRKRPSDQLENLIPEFDKVLFRDSYELIWQSLTKAEKELMRCIVHTTSGKAADIKSRMLHPGSYDSLRARLENKHVINTETYGYIYIDLPRFREFVLLWHDDEIRDSGVSI